MTILALDIGEKRCGIAVSDASEKIAIPISTLSTAEVMQNAPAFRRIIEDHEPRLLICGLPVSLNGNENKQAVRIRGQAEQIAERNGLPLEFVDERMSSSEARRILHESGHSERSMRGKVDMIAASLILETYLESQ